MRQTIELEKVMDLKGGENSHLDAALYVQLGDDGQPIARTIYNSAHDLGAKVRLPGWTNVGDISASLRTVTHLGEIYEDSDEPFIVTASKHTRPVILAKGRTQRAALIKALAGDVNSPFGGFFAFNTELELSTAEFLDKLFFEGTIAPSYEKDVVPLLTNTEQVKAHQNRFLIETGNISSSDVDVFDHRMTPVAFAHYIKQSQEKPFYALDETAVITGNKGNNQLRSLGTHIINDIDFAGNAAIYLASNLVFFVSNGAIAGLGDACGARTMAAEKARRNLEVSVYAAASGKYEMWERVLYDTPFTREHFELITAPTSLVAFSDAFFPKLDGFIETAGIDRVDPRFGENKFEYIDGKVGKIFIPKRNNFDPEYNEALLPKVIVQPGGSLGDKQVLPLAAYAGITMVYTMDKDTFKQYASGKKATGRRFFGHNIM